MMKDSIMISLFLASLVAIGFGFGYEFGKAYGFESTVPLTKAAPPAVNYVCGDKICGTNTKEDRDILFDQTMAYNHNRLQDTPKYNYSFALIMTPTGQSLNNVILSAGNMSELKNNVGVFTACGGFDHGLCTPPVITTSETNTNYCGLALWILTNQDGYLNNTYAVAPNGTVIRDLTHYVYPDYCLMEAGQNPYSPIKPVSVPEFPGVFTGVLFVIVMSSVVILALKKR